MARTGSCTAAVKDETGIAFAALFFAQGNVVTEPSRVHTIISPSRQHTRHACCAWFQACECSGEGPDLGFST